MMHGMSFDELRTLINDTLNQGEEWTRWVRDIYEDRVIVSDDHGTELYEAPYTVSPDGSITLGEMRRVRLEYVAARAIALDAGGEVPAEIQVIPFGRTETVKGVFVLDEEGARQVVAEFEARENDMVIYYEHKTLTGDEAPAAGWIKKLVNKGSEGIWAVVEWTARAKQYLEAREYRYLSPVFLFEDGTGRVVRLFNAGLTNIPAIDGMVPVVNK